MINLMSPAMKEQIRYAKLNAQVIRYAQVTVVVVAVLAGVFGWAVYTLQTLEGKADKDVAIKRAQITSLNATFVPKAREASERLAAIAYVKATQTHFSNVISDIAKVVPQGVSIDSMILTGDETKPVRIGIAAQTYQSALAFRNALATSPRIVAADLESITTASDGTFQAAIVVGFKPGQAK
jgi:Tfp pilus assembly protein PilN